MVKKVVFVPELIASCGMDLLRETCECVAPWEDGASLAVDSPQLREMLYQADAVIVRLFTVGEQDLQKTGRLQVIGKHGAGVDNIDCKAATARGIPVVFAPDATTGAVAEYTVGLILTLSRQILPASAALREGRFNERDRFLGVELAGKTLGIIGLGRIGAWVARIAALGLDMEVCAYDPFAGPRDHSGPVTMVDTLEDLLSRADFLTLHVPLTPETRHLINEQTLKLLKPGGLIINTSRGGVIDQEALERALRQGTLAGAALDVFEEEPLLAAHPLCQAPNLLLTPHIAGSTRQSRGNTALQVAQGVLDVLQGRTPDYVANPEVFA